jgi:hypothetical protein
MRIGCAKTCTSAALKPWLKRIAMSCREWVRSLGGPSAGRSRHGQPVRASHKDASIPLRLAGSLTFPLAMGARWPSTPLTPFDSSTSIKSWRALPIKRQHALEHKARSCNCDAKLTDDRGNIDDTPKCRSLRLGQSERLSCHQDRCAVPQNHLCAEMRSTAC